MVQHGGFKAAGMGSICFVIGLLSWAACAVAQSDLIDQNDTGQISEAIYVSSGAPMAVSGPLHLTVLVDQKYCATGGVQCTGTGHTAKAPGKTNHNPVRVMVQVLDVDKVPVTGLESSFFTISSPAVPAGGPSLARLECGQCFVGSENGVYTFFIHPALAGNWKAGSYCLQVHVTNGSLESHAIALITIP